MLKVRIILPNQAKGGAERILAGLGNSISNEYSVEFLILSEGGGNGFQLSQPFKILRGSFLLNMLFKLPSHLHMLRNEDMVISSQFYLNIWISCLKWLNLVKAKSIVRESTRIFQRFTGWRYNLAKWGVKAFYRQHNLIIAQTAGMANDILEIQEQLPVVILPNPIDLSGFSYENETSSFEWSGSSTIMSAGRLIPIKQFSILLRAFSKLDAKYQLVIFGEGPEEQKLRAEARTLGVMDRFWLPGVVDNPRKYFANANACVVSSELEGFPNVLLEMMSVNGAVISTTCADGIESLPGITTCPILNVDALTQAMAQALAFTAGEKEARFVKMKEHLTGRSFEGFWERIIYHVNASE